MMNILHLSKEITKNICQKCRLYVDTQKIELEVPFYTSYNICALCLNKLRNTIDRAPKDSEAP